MLLLGCAIFMYLRNYKRVQITSVITITIVAVALAFGNIPQQYTATGIYRYEGKALDNSKYKSMRFYQDEKTASIAVLEHLDKKNNEEVVVSVLIATNGKVDAALTTNLNNHTADEMTMVTLGLLPLLALPNATVVANIGFGSGLTTRALLQSPNIKRIDNIEIEPMMVEGAQYLGNKVAPVFSDRRNHFIFDDAKSVFAQTKWQYDIYLSEPSNPWVSGVSGLFTQEFYQRVKQALTDNGLFVQWLPFYESTPEIFSSKEFEGFRIHLSRETDAIFLATKGGSLPNLTDQIFTYPAARKFFNHYGFSSAVALDSLFVGDKKHMMPYLKAIKAPINSDYFPYLEYAAPKAFFQRRIYAWVNARYVPVPFIEMTGMQVNPPQITGEFPHSRISSYIKQTQQFFSEIDNKTSTMYKNIDHLGKKVCNNEDEKTYMHTFNGMIYKLMPFTSIDNMTQLWQRLATYPCIKNRLVPTDQSVEGLHTQFLHALSLRDSNQLLNTTIALSPYLRP